MEPILIRYGESVTLPIDTGDTTDQSADIYIGRPGELYAITKNVTLTDGQGTFVLESNETEIPLGTYYYQINVTTADGYIEKFPSPDEDCGDCDNEFPEFIVREALDATEVS